MPDLPYIRQRSLTSLPPWLVFMFRRNSVDFSSLAARYDKFSRRVDRTLEDDGLFKRVRDEASTTPGRAVGLGR